MRVAAFLAWCVVLAIAATVAYAYLFPVDFRNTAPVYVAALWVAFMVRTFTFQIGVAALLPALVALLMRRWRLLAVNAAVLAATLGPDAWQYRPKSPPPIAGEVVTVMSVNLLAGNHETKGIVAEVVAARPDVVLFQEYTPYWHTAIDAALAADHPYAHAEVRRDSFGMAVYARRPFVGEVAVFTLSNVSTPQFRTVFRIDGREVALYDIHLVPPRVAANRTQNLQFADLLDRLRAEELPMIVGGDFNFTDASPFAAALHELGLHDAHDTGGHGRGATWPNRTILRHFPGIRIDHLYISSELTCTHSAVGAGDGSDHRPIVGGIGFTK